MKDLQKQLQSRRLSFASEEDLYKYMRLKAWEVTPFGILNDNELSVNVVFDNDLFEIIGIHPVRNDKTLFMKINELIRMIKEHGNSFESIHIE